MKKKSSFRWATQKEVQAACDCSRPCIDTTKENSKLEFHIKTCSNYKGQILTYLFTKLGLDMAQARSTEVWDAQQDSNSLPV